MKPDEVRVLVGLRIAEARRAAGLTQAGLAGRLGTNQSYVARVEKGRAVPTVPQLYRWAEALAVDPGALLGSTPVVNDPGV